MMKNLKRTLAPSLLSGFLFVALLQAQAPQMINYQGKLVINGSPVQNPRNITFTIYDQKTGGAALWSERKLVSVTNGVFTVLLGDNSTNPFPKNLFTRSGNRFLAMSVDDLRELPQRFQLTSVAYALNAARADTAQVALAANRLDAPDGSPANAVFVDKDGNVGIGTTIPAAKLEVAGIAIIRGSQFEIQGQDLQLGTKDLRPIGNKNEQRALVHNFGDVLNVNYAGDFEGGTIIHGSGATPNLFVSADSNGNVGIGTKNPSAKLQVDNGTVHLSDPNLNHGVTIIAPSNVYARIREWRPVGGGIEILGFNDASATDNPGIAISGVLYDETKNLPAVRLSGYKKNGIGVGSLSASGKLLSITNFDSELFTVRAGGNVGIGTTNPTEKLSVAGNICATGNITGNMTQCSSKEYKENFTDLSLQEAVATLENLAPIKFIYKADEQKDLHVGFIAEDVPELVATPDRKGVSPMDIVAVLTKVVQAQQKEITALREEVNALKQLVK
jgi:hypothetical protein